MTFLAHQSNLSIIPSRLLRNIAIKDLIHPLNTTFTISNHDTLIEKIDKDFKDSSQRTDNFYVK